MLFQFQLHLNHYLGAKKVFRVSVQFTYQKYRVVYSGSYDIAAAAAALFGVKASKFFDKAGQSISNALVAPLAGTIF